MSSEKKYPKVLIVSHNILSDSSNMGKTLKSFFEGWPADCLAQLYFREEEPLNKMCCTYYKITDFNIFKSLYKGIEVGTVFDEMSINRNVEDNQTKHANIYNYGKQRKPYMYMLRNILWGTKKWNNEKLNKWIKEFSPDVIYFASGDYIFSYEICLYIASTYNIPLILGVYDDYYIDVKKTLSPIYHLNKKMFNKRFKKIVSLSSQLIYVCDLMKEDYNKLFDVKGIALMTPSNMIPTEYSTKEQIKISYIGNLGLNRWKSLVKIGESLVSISEGKQPVYLDIYSIETRKEIIENLTKEKGIRFHGSINREQVREVMYESDILIHVESTDKADIDRVKYSISTKISDSLACGRCIFAYGPKGVASIEYLLENNAACVVIDEEGIEEKLSKLLNDVEIRKKYIQRGLELAQKRHGIEENKEIFRGVINNTIKKWEEDNESITSQLRV